MVLELTKTRIGQRSLSQMLKPEFYEEFVITVRSMAMNSNQLGLALTIYVKQLARLKIAAAIAGKDKYLRNEGEEFVLLYDSCWIQRVSSQIGKRKRMEKLNKPDELPLEADLTTLTEYINKEIGNTSGVEDLPRLKDLVLASILLFNKRRPMEVHDMKVSDFISAKEKITDEQEKEVLDKLSATERAIAKRC